MIHRSTLRRAPPVLVAATAVASLLRPGPPPAATAPALERAETAFAEGRLEEAAAGYAAALAERPGDPRALLQGGRLALWRHRLAEAGPRLARAHQSSPGEETLDLLLTLAYRRGDFAAAADRARELGREARAAQLDHLSPLPPYRVRGDVAETILPFVRTDPLPLVELSVNGSEPALFLIDTGGGELILDPGFAESVGAGRFGSRTGTFAGDQRAEVELGAVEGVGLGELLVENVPVRLLSTARFAPVAGGRTVHGILGTTLLSRFVFTLDYPAGRLVLRRPDAAAPAVRPGSATVPVWLAGDHLILAEGRIGGARPGLMLIDTGLAGGGFAASDSTLAEAGIGGAGGEIEGEGGGGRVRATPVVAPEIALGPVVRRDVPGFAGVFPASLEHRLGCRIAGLLSHGFLRGHAVTFDLARSEMTLAPPGDPAEPGSR
ncbi:MAG: aspartyl protease family protein [Thermoanaerobaculia bacterium]|nr:aspartyl protease family protein [Thermoanaerobaculia bacterium]